MRKSRFQSRLEEMEAMKKSLADRTIPESNKITKEDIFDFDLKDFIEEELKQQKGLDLIRERGNVMRLKYDITSNINSTYKEEHINHLDKTIEYLNKKIDKIIDSTK